jgi:malate dehydrogenase (oxaloacetate-decarboxylating)
MVKAAATELIRHLPTQTNKAGSLLPTISEARGLGRYIAEAVGKQALKDRQAQVSDENALSRELDANIWEPVYESYEHTEE